MIEFCHGRGTRRGEDLATLDQFDVRRRSDEQALVQEDAPEQRLDIIGRTEEDRVSSATAARSSGGPRIPAAVYSGRVALHSSRCRGRIVPAHLE